MNAQNRPQQRAATDEPQPLRITLEGPPEIVTRLLAGMHAALSGPASPEPAQLFMKTNAAAAYTGLSADQLAGLVKIGKLTNHGRGRTLVFSRAELTALAEQGV